MAVRAEPYVSFLDVLLAFGTHGIVGDPRVDVERLPFRRLHAKSSMAKPRKFDSFKIHKLLLRMMCELAVSLRGEKSAIRRNPRIFTVRFKLFAFRHFGYPQTRV